MKQKRRVDMAQLQGKTYKFFSFGLVLLFALLFLFPLYWILTGAFKTGAEVNASTPVWIPSQWVMDNFKALMERRSTPLFRFTLGNLVITGPKIPAAWKWLINSVFMAGATMVITCITAAMAGYVLAKKRFYGRSVLFGLVVCAMALPKQVILIPLVRLMSLLNLYDNMWAVILPVVGWPFGVFMLKQFSESVPGEMIEAARIDGAGEWRTFSGVVVPMIKPGIGALAIFTFITAWNDYFMQLIMLTGTDKLTISLGIATMQGETSADYGLLMAGSAMASVPIIVVFLIFQKYFTKGITMGAVKG